MRVTQAARTIPTYFTVWNVALIVGCAVSAKIHQSIDLLLTSTVILLISTYLLYVRPGYFRMVVSWGEDDGQESYIIVSGRMGLLLHVVFHVVPFFLVALVYGRYYMRKGVGTHTLAAVLLFLFYVKLVRFEEVYAIEYEHMAIVGISSTVGYLLYKGIWSHL